MSAVMFYAWQSKYLSREKYIIYPKTLVYEKHQ